MTSATIGAMSKKFKRGFKRSSDGLEQGELFWSEADLWLKELHTCPVSSVLKSLQY